MWIHQSIGLFVTFIFGLMLNLVQGHYWGSGVIAQAMPDWLFLVVVFWGVRVSRLSYIWCAWVVGCVHSLMLDETFGFYSFVYAAGALIVQNARLRLLVVSTLEQNLFIYLLIVAYLFISGLTFRFDGNGLQLSFLVAFVGHVIGWLCISICLQSLYPLARENDLFSRR